MINRRTVLTLSTVLLTIIFITLQIVASNRERYQSSSSFSRNARGLSIAADVINRISPKSFSTKGSAFLDGKDLESNAALLIFNPKAPPSPREVTILKTFVENGGHLYLSMERGSSKAKFDTLYQALQIELQIYDDPEFKNGVAKFVTRGADVGPLFRSDDTYAVYSPILFDEPSCTKGLRCYVVQHHVKGGTVTTMLGLPLIANGLIGEGDNKEFLFRLGDRHQKLISDEYHQLFSDKTFADLFMTPSFVIPIFGLLGGALLYFFLSDRDETNDPGDDEAPRAVSFHDMNEAVLMGSIKSSSMNEQIADFQGAYLRKKYPRYRTEVAEVEKRYGQNPKRARELVIQLLGLHKFFIERRKGA